MPAVCPSCSLPRPFSPQLLALLVVVAGQADDCHCVFMCSQNLAANQIKSMRVLYQRLHPQRW
ncbi:hypothetical protein QR685DRAFT_529972 [Neurospora intermedia]|uniref:Secreted protein n=1 Tax=Neurospora intermedia TaxID=5142 RepID=A0ABR3D924_NEUIN